MTIRLIKRESRLYLPKPRFQIWQNTLLTDGNKWRNDNSLISIVKVDEREQWSEKVRSHRFCPHMLDQNKLWRAQIKKNHSLSLSLPPEMAQTFISEIKWFRNELGLGLGFLYDDYSEYN